MALRSRPLKQNPKMTDWERFEKAYGEARTFKKKSLESALVSESKVMHASVGAPRISDEEYRGAVLPYWKKYGREPQKFWFELYGSRDGITEPGFVPADMYFTELIPYINNLDMLWATADKCYYDLRFPDVRRAQTVCRRISGLYYDADMRLIPQEEAVRLCLGHDGGMVIKPSVYSNNSQSIHVIDPSRYDETGMQDLMDHVGANFIAQDLIKQHPGLARLNPASVNTIRVNSLLTQDGVYIASASVRAGAPGESIVSTGSGGFFAEILGDDTLCSKALLDSVKWRQDGPGGESQLQHILKWSDDCAGGLYDPEYRIPAMDKIRRQVELLHPRLAHFKWLGWDWTVDEEGEPVLIEFNGSPGIIVSQMTSCRPVFGEMTGWILDDYFIHRTWEKNQRQGLIYV